MSSIYSRKQLTLRSEGLKWQLVAPGSRSFAGVGADLEDVVGDGLKSVDNDRRLGGVGWPLVGRVASIVVQQLVQYDLAVAVLSGRRVPLQSHAGRAHAYRSEIERRAGRNYATKSVTFHSSLYIERFSTHYRVQ